MPTPRGLHNPLFKAGQFTTAPSSHHADGAADAIPPTPALPTTSEPPALEVAKRDTSDTYPHGNNPLFGGRGGSGPMRPQEQPEQHGQQQQQPARISPPQSTAPSATQPPDLPPAGQTAGSSPPALSSPRLALPPPPATATAATPPPPAAVQASSVAAAVPASPVTAPAAAHLPEESVPSATAGATSTTAAPAKAGKAAKGKTTKLLLCCGCAVLVLGLIALAVALPLCLVRGCPAPKADPNAIGEEEGLYNFRLLARSEDAAKSVSDLIPPLLRTFVDVTLLEDSLIEVLDFSELSVLREVRSQLLAKYKDQLTFLIPDFPVRISPDLNLAVQSGIPAEAAAAAQALNVSLSLEALTALLPESGKAALRAVADEVAAAASDVVAGGGSGGGLSSLLSALSGGAGTLLAGLQRPQAARAEGSLEEHDALVAAAAAGSAKDLSGVLSGSAGGTATDASTQWYLNKALVPGAWKLTQGIPDVVVAVLDTGFDINHPDLWDNLWVNTGEQENPLDRADNDGNGYADDLNGYDFAGSVCQGDWRQPPPAARPPPPSPPPPSRLPPPPPAKRPVAVNVKRAATTGSTVVTSANQLAKVCTPDADVKPEVGDEGHGTHVAGIVAASRNSAAGIAGAAPKVKLMLLKVFDAQKHVFASHVVAAYAYALRNGAHIISCSFGPDSAILAPQPFDLDRMRGEAALYGSAVRPLEDKGVLLLAAAGNELTDLNGLASVGSNYLPCTLPNSNVLCVAASNQVDLLITGMNGNTPVGSNYGSSVVDLAAPGQDVYNTIPTAQGSYGNKSGSSMATPLVAGVAALVASVVGSAGAPAAAPNYYQASRVKALLLESADALPGLPVRGNRRLNAQRAVQAASASTAGSYLLTSSATYYTTNGGAASLLAAGLSEEYYAATVVAATVGANAPSAVAFANVVLPAAPSDTSVRVPSASSPVTYLRSYRLNATAPASQPSASGALVLRLVGLLRLAAPGTWGVQLVGPTPASAVRLKVGQRVIEFAELGASATLVAEAAGLYDFELLVLNPQQPVELRWATPSAPGTYSTPSADMFVIPSYSPAVHPRFAPNLTLTSTTPPGFHLSWDYASPDTDPDRPQQPLPPAFLASFSTGLTPSTGPYAPLRNSAYSPAALFPAPGALGAMVVNATLAAAALPNAAPGIVAPNLNVAGVYGLAVGHMTPPSTGQIQLQVTCSSCRLYVQGVLVIDAAQPLLLGSAAAAAAAPAPITGQSGCLALSAGATAASPGGAAAYTLELRFLMGDATRGVLSLQWSPCTTPGGAVGPQWSSLGGLLTSSVMWAPSASAVFSRSALRCDVWEKLSPADAGAVPSPRDRTPTASFTLPRPGASNQLCTKVTSTNPACKAVARLSVQDVMPTAKEGNDGYHVRCWAFFNGTFLRGTFAMRIPDAATAVYLGSQQIMLGAASNAAPTAFNRQSVAPRVTAGGPYLPLLSFEYPDVTAVVYMGVLDGVDTISVTDSMLIDARLIVPAQL